MCVRSDRLCGRMAWPWHQAEASPHMTAIVGLSGTLFFAMSLQTILLVLNAGVFAMVFTFGLKASVRRNYLFRRPAELARALLAMNVLMPLFAVSLVLIFDLTPVVKFTLVALSVSPILPVAPLRMLKAGATSGAPRSEFLSLPVCWQSS